LTNLSAISRLQVHGRMHAETAIELALLVCEACDTSEAQLADLANAGGALRAGQFRIAVELAEAVIEKRPKLQTPIKAVIDVEATATFVSRRNTH